MKINWKLIKFTILMLAIGFLLSFSKKRNEARNIKKISIEFVDDDDPLITLNAVNKLLIQNNDSVTSIGKETLVLNEMEHRLLQNPMIRNAEVYVTVDGVLGAKIEQRKPIARVNSRPDFYLDEDGKKMPLSVVYTARVPLVTGRSKSDFTELTPLLLKIKQDEFMNKSVIGLHQHTDGKVELRIRKHDFKVLLGVPESIDKKFQNFKAFYKKAKSDKILNNYNLINLEFGDQVVATKK